MPKASNLGCVTNMSLVLRYQASERSAARQHCTEQRPRRPRLAPPAAAPAAAAQVQCGPRPPKKIAHGGHNALRGAMGDNVRVGWLPVYLHSLCSHVSSGSAVTATFDVLPCFSPASLLSPIAASACLPHPRAHADHELQWRCGAGHDRQKLCGYCDVRYIVKGGLAECRFRAAQRAHPCRALLRGRCSRPTTLRSPLPFCTRRDKRLGVQAMTVSCDFPKVFQMGER